jgi:hypothetical protein
MRFRVMHLSGSERPRGCRNVGAGGGRFSTAIRTRPIGMMGGVPVSPGRFLRVRLAVLLNRLRRSSRRLDWVRLLRGRLHGGSLRGLTQGPAEVRLLAGGDPVRDFLLEVHAQLLLIDVPVGRLPQMRTSRSGEHRHSAHSRHAHRGEQPDDCPATRSGESHDRHDGHPRTLTTSVA